MTTNKEVKIIIGNEDLPNDHNLKEGVCFCDYCVMGKNEYFKMKVQEAIDKIDNDMIKQGRSIEPKTYGQLLSDGD